MSRESELQRRLKKLRKGPNKDPKEFWPANANTTLSIPGNIVDDETIRQLAKPEFLGTMPPPLVDESGKPLMSFYTRKGEPIPPQDVITRKKELSNADFMSQLIDSRAGEDYWPGSVGSLVELTRDEDGHAFTTLMSKNNTSGKNYGIVLAHSPQVGRTVTMFTPEAFAKHEKSCGHWSAVSPEALAAHYEHAPGEAPGSDSCREEGSNCPFHDFLRSGGWFNQVRSSVPEDISTATGSENHTYWEPVPGPKGKKLDESLTTSRVIPLGDWVCAKNQDCPLYHHLNNCIDGVESPGCELHKYVRKVNYRGRVFAQVQRIARSFKNTALSGADEYQEQHAINVDGKKALRSQELKDALGEHDYNDLWNIHNAAQVDRIRKIVAAGGRELLPDPELTTKIVDTFVPQDQGKFEPSIQVKPNDVLNMFRTNPRPPENKIKSIESSRLGYAHPEKDVYPQTHPCRFCDDPAFWGTKGNIVQTGVAEDGRPLFAHSECVPNANMDLPTGVSESLGADEEFERLSSFRVFNSSTRLSCINCNCEIERPGFCKQCSYYIYGTDENLADAITGVGNKDVANSTIRHQEVLRTTGPGTTETVYPGSGTTPA